MPTGTAKRFGWNVVLTPEQELDREAYNELDQYDSDDLEGEIVVYESRTGGGVLVGGEEADPETLVYDLEPADDDE